MSIGFAVDGPAVNLRTGEFDMSGYEWETLIQGFWDFQEMLNETYEFYRVENERGGPDARAYLLDIKAFECNLQWIQREMVRRVPELVNDQYYIEESSLNFPLA